MALQHVVVDGSNIATEGRSVPSLRQLDEAVTAFLEERGDVELTVVVDATFGHRISDDEKAEYEDAILNGELVTPPAGAIGRGDAFVLQIADKAKASVFSNDSFQEFHGSYEWLFDEGRLIGGKPVRNVGWVFVLRNPVRGPTSRRATREARTPAPPRTSPARVRKSAAKQTTPASSPDTPSPSRSARRPKPAEAAATVSRPENDEDSGHGRRRRSGTQSADPINEPLPFLEFVGAHPLGSRVDGTVDRFSSHGAYVLVDGTHCYIPLKALSDPPPTSAREVLELGQVHSFVVQSFDSARRGVDLALLSPSDPSASAPPVPDLPIATQPAEEAPGMAVAKKTTAKKTTATKSVAKKSPAKAVAKKATSAAKKTAAATKSVVKKATTAAKKPTAGKTAAKKTTAKKTTAKKTAAATKTTAKKTAATTKAPAKKTTTAKAAATRKAAPRKTAANS